MRAQPTLLVVVAALTVAVLPVVASASAGETTATVGSQDSAPTTRVVAYYFHGDVRCATCRKIEAYTAEAIRAGFPEEIDSGRLEWRVVNTDQPGNAHFVDDFELVTKSVVLVAYRGEEVERFENLRLIWQLVRDRDGFLRYVREATRDFLQDG